jgi:hypothetical protein
MGCTQAEILRLLELIEEEVFMSKPSSLEEARKRFLRVKFTLREKSVAELRSMLGL